MFSPLWLFAVVIGTSVVFGGAVAIVGLAMAVSHAKEHSK